MEADCTALKPAPLDLHRYDWVSGSEDFTFDADGYLIQVTGGGLKRTPFGGPPELLVPLDADVAGPGSSRTGGWSSRPARTGRCWRSIR